MREENTDVVIIGGGPAGSCAASLLAKQGRDVILLEKDRFPRHHVGESTLLGLTKMLDVEIGAGSIISSAGFRIKTGGSYIWGKDRNPWSFHFWELGSKNIAYQVDRSEFDSLLLKHCRSLGADAREECKVTNIVFKNRAIRISYVNGNKQENIVHAKYVIDASGLSAILGRQLGLHRSYEVNRNVALYGYWKAKWLPYDELGGDITPSDSSNILVINQDNYWIWIIPLSADRASVGIVFGISDLQQLKVYGRHDFYMRKISNSVEASKVLMDAKYLEHEPLRLVQDWSQMCDSVCGPGFFLAGDAAAFVDPILSSGVTLATMFGIAAAKAINTLFKYGDTAQWVYDWYQHTYLSAYNDFRRMADFWYLGSKRKEDWFHVAFDRVRDRTRKDMDQREAFVRIASGTFTVGEFYDRECYVDQDSVPITVFFFPFSGHALFHINNRKMMARHLEGFPHELAEPILNPLPKSAGARKVVPDINKSLVNPKIRSDLRIGVYTEGGSPYINICCYLTMPEGEMIAGSYIALTPLAWNIVKMLDGRTSIQDLSKALQIDVVTLTLTIDRFSQMGLLE